MENIKINTKNMELSEMEIDNFDITISKRNNEIVMIYIKEENGYGNYLSINLIKAVNKAITLTEK